ncbi:TonB-linked SusC/RagA family outer membrane protein [Flavobacterium nitrogenifigens]|uniref:TonB-linked SusC/RagA family outer membrane protein n=2 Tax=Flavobacterium TaxID=237 RepID=A0A7W7J056_9FLAO|nr:MULTISPECIES: SusC/RagA family TonB-linked outer membrane protein [Flavobacterium]MBB4803737.1 TonB-linked SusC/RagA family outer membrane protein [Flavobacterium nitrogenifigens]MBB6388458.1 TonB-linked SusC/RagA family outer membrane protein [Flavobacterium notoginsengisoli]
MKLKFNGLLVLLLVLVAQLSFAQERIVSGIVSDNTGMPIPGVSVLVKGTKTGTQTDFDGKYSIKATPTQTLVFTYIGMKAKEESAASTTVNTKLVGDALELEGVVVVAFGTQKKSEITGAVTKIDAKALENAQASNAIQSLTGKVAGVQISANSGQPGDPPQVRFRGIGSLSSSNAPLYVVDGIPYNGDINAIATQDIESISFLKDASSNALYGSRGANGVIIVTTKKGKKGQLRVTYETKIGVNSRAVPEYDMIKDPGEYYETVYGRIKSGLMYQGQTAANASTIAANTLISGDSYSLGYNNYNVADNQVINPATGKLNPNAKLLYHDDWANALFRDATRTEHFLSLSSSTDNLSSYLSVGYLKDNGYTVNSDFKRATVRANVDYNINSKIKVGANLNYANSDQNAPISQVSSSTYSNLFSWARNIAPIYTIYERDAAGNYVTNADGSRVYDFNKSGNRPYGANLNPYATTLLNTNLNQENKFGARGYVSIDFLKDFNFRYNLGYDLMSGYYLNSTTGEGGDDMGVNGRIGTASEDDYTITNQQLLSWKKSIGNHNIDILVGHESSDFTSKMLAGQKSGVVIPGLPVLSNATKYNYVDGYNDLYNVEGYFSRANYSYKDKYFVNASFRRDGSSVFHPDNRWGNFYGFGAAWSVAKESFFPQSKVVTDLRIKGSYGEQGNDNIFYPASTVINHRSYFGSGRNYYAYQNQYEIVPDADGNATVLQVFTGNKDIKWEVSKNMNVGFEIELFNRVNIEAEYFERKVSDLIYNKPLSPSTGTNFVSENIGDMANKGIEVNLGIDVVKTQDFDFNIWANATHYKNEVTSLPSPFTSGIFRFQVGAPAYAFYLREFAGVDKTNGDALWYMDVKDASGAVTGKTTTNVYGNATQYLSDKDANPDVYGGFGTVVRYKKLTLQASLAYQFGGYMYDGVYASAMYSGGDNIGQNYHKDTQKAWTVDNPNSDIPRIDHVSTLQMATSDYFLTKSDYISIQDVSLSYDFTNSKLTDLGISSTKFSVMGTNLALWSERKGMDPRLNNLGTRSNNGQSLNVYGVMRTISFGLTVNF